MKLRRTLTVVVLTSAIPLATVPLAHATFRDAGSSGATFAAAQLAPPSGLSAKMACTVSVLNIVLAASVQLTWVPSSSSWSTGQRVEVRNGAGSLVGSRDLAPTVSSTSISLPLVLGGSYTATVHAIYSSWTSSTSTATVSGC